MAAAVVTLSTHATVSAAESGNAQVSAGQGQAAAAAPAPAVVTPGQQLMVDQLISALNAGGGQALDQWIGANVILSPTNSVGNWRDWFGRIARTAAPLTLDRVDPPTASRELRVWVKTKNGAMRRFGLFADPEGSDRVASFVIAVWPTAWPGPMIRAEADDETLAMLVRTRVEFGAGLDEFSGVAVLADRGRVVGQATAGLADRQNGVTNQPDTRFHIASMGKMFTAVAIARLIEDGKLRFDSRLIDVLPDYPDRAAAEAITIAHLLSHTSGISLPYVEPTSPKDADPERVSDSLAGIAATPLAFTPGSRASYSNEGYTVLGAVIEAVTGESYYDVIQREVFDRAGMADTAFDRPGPLAADTAQGYRYGADDALGVMPRESNAPFLLDRGGPSGGAYSTTADMTRFLNAFRDGRLVSPAMAEALLTAEPNGQNRYGKGFSIIPVGERKMVGHSGGGPNSGINTDAMIVWETGWSYAVFGNYDAPAAQAVAGAFLAAAVAQPAS
ncbi:serine hydrolase [Brevundimonas sp. Root1423]|uniref:serine hydrolase domain-containing protein n=1 Tax=Brevundimonas sp. Root1423 TaxID=1736462 RepID=UPI00138F52E6|nr:serine hydrolase domain-containing protein [Brevundimonas sp. Root1423]